MLTADEANLIAYRANEPERLARDRQTEEDVAEILDKVKTAAQNGDYTLVIDLRAQPLKADAFAVTLYLKSLGFECERCRIAPQRTVISDDLIIKWWND